MVNKAPQEIPLIEDAEELIDAFRRHLGRLEAHLTLLDDYRQDRQIMRALDRRGVDSEWARRELAHRWKTKGVVPNDNEAA